MWIFIVITGRIADLLRYRHLLSTTNVRKLMNALGQSLLFGYVKSNQIKSNLLAISEVHF